MAKNLMQDACDLIYRYLEVLADINAGIIRDESILPASKEKVKEALMLALATAPNELERECLRQAFTHLGDFLPNVGKGITLSESDWNRYNEFSDSWRIARPN